MRDGLLFVRIDGPILCGLGRLGLRVGHLLAGCLARLILRDRWLRGLLLDDHRHVGDGQDAAVVRLRGVDDLQDHHAHELQRDHRHEGIDVVPVVAPQILVEPHTKGRPADRRWRDPELEEEPRVAELNTAHRAAIEGDE